MPVTPKSNGLFEVNGSKETNRGFCCMKLISFMFEDPHYNDWDEWHNAHVEASQGKCRFKEQCSIYRCSKRKQNQEPVQLEFEFKN